MGPPPPYTCLFRALLLQHLSRFYYVQSLSSSKDYPKSSAYVTRMGYLVICDEERFSIDLTHSKVRIDSKIALFDTLRWLLKGAYYLHP